MEHVGEGRSVCNRLKMAFRLWVGLGGFQDHPQWSISYSHGQTVAVVEWHLRAAMPPPVTSCQFFSRWKFPHLEDKIRGYLFWTKISDKVNLKALNPHLQGVHQKMQDVQSGASTIEISHVENPRVATGEILNPSPIQSGHWTVETVSEVNHGQFFGICWPLSGPNIA